MSRYVKKVNKVVASRRVMESGSAKKMLLKVLYSLAYYEVICKR